MKSRLLVGSLVVALAAALAGCGGPDDSGPVVATSRVTLNHGRVPLGSPLEVTYEFTVAEDARFDGDYIVFSHFLDADDEMMWTDDHHPPTPTSAWKPGETIKYTRLLFVPVYPYVGEASLRVGLYAPDGRRLRLAGDDNGQRAYRSATFEVLPQTENIYVTFKDGWHPGEVAADGGGTEWHWTKKDATLAFKNPRRDVVLFLDVDGRTQLLPAPQSVTVSAGGRPVGTFELGDGPEIKRLPIAAAQLGSEDKVELTVSVDRTFVPAAVSAGAQKDVRELGVRVFHAFVDAR
ncbi:MAG TPA: hypothetical protein VK911_01820 [Vicinamibacterales bacterium]|nr:hypothetical protein [Vicinamibacterales bacterium]